MFKFLKNLFNKYNQKPEEKYKWIYKSKIENKNFIYFYRCIVEHNDDTWKFDVYISGSYIHLTAYKNDVIQIKDYDVHNYSTDFFNQYVEQKSNKVINDILKVYYSNNKEL